jgi:hypothetical protein
MIIEGIAQRWVSKLVGTWGLQLTQQGALRVAQLDQEGDEYTAAGRRFHIGFTSAVTGIAPVAAIPSTAAQWLLWNPAGNTVTQLIDELGVALVSGTAAGGLVVYMAKVYGAYAPTAANIPVASATGITTENRGLPNKASALVIASAQTLANAPKNIYPIAKSDSANTGVLSVAAVNNDIRGKIAIQPGSGLALYVGSGAGTSPLFAPFGSYREIEADLQ